MNHANRSILIYSEAELYVNNLKIYNIDDIGTKSWFQQHEWIEKLNMQAIINATSNEDEYVKDLLVTLEKIPVIIYDLIVSEVWKQVVFPRILKIKNEPWISFPIYMVLHHEATIVNLLETILYHEDCCESISEVIVDLVDYCHRKLLTLITEIQTDEENWKSISSEKLTELTTLEQLEKQNKDIEFNICLKVLAIVRYLTDHLKSLPLFVTSRLLNTHDFPMILVSLIEDPPWKRMKGADTEKFINGKWQEISVEDQVILTKTEGQVWIALFHLLIDQHCQSKYDLNNFRKNKILKLRPHMTEVMLDQLPPLVALRQYLEHLSFMESPPAKKDLILEQIPEIWGTTMKCVENDLDKIVEKHVENLCNNSEEFYKIQAKQWADIYNVDVIEKVITDTHKCAFCGDVASKRCSRCHSEWYCRRECQVKHWKKHSTTCDLILNAKDAEDSSKTLEDN